MSLSPVYPYHHQHIATTTTTIRNPYALPHAYTHTYPHSHILHRKTQTLYFYLYTTALLKGKKWRSIESSLDLFFICFLSLFFVRLCEYVPCLLSPYSYFVSLKHPCLIKNNMISTMQLTTTNSSCSCICTTSHKKSIRVSKRPPFVIFYHNTTT